MTTSESKDRLFTKRIDSNRFESRIGMLYSSVSKWRSRSAKPTDADCLEADSHQTKQDRRACLSTAAAATQARQAATPSRPTAHTQRRCTPRKM